MNLRIRSGLTFVLVNSLDSDFQKSVFQFLPVPELTKALLTLLVGLLTLVGGCY